MNGRVLGVRAVLIALVWAVSLCAHGQVATAAAVKAAYIYRFLEYVTWPAESFRSAEDPVLIGTMEYDDVAAELVRVARTRRINNRRIEVVLVREEAGVHALYVARTDTTRGQRLIDNARERPVLVITDGPDGLDRGGTINFVPSGDRLQFEISLEAATRAGLTVSSRLLTVAVRIRKSDASGSRYAGRGSHLLHRALGFLGDTLLGRDGAFHLAGAPSHETFAWR
ncbi:MAG: YfiR family protein [Betaproteobacteria bacterium]|nr:YfiR family protein [Betaproteobacteria bacterium]